MSLRAVRWRIAIVVGLILACGLILGYKFWPRGGQPEIPSGPVLLLFNRYQGCECALVVYEAAEGQVNAWAIDVPVVVINLDQQRSLGAQYKVVRAPTLILLDGAGQVVLRQDHVVTDLEPLDLERFELAIQNLKEAGGD
jgi:hypothetical protein